MLLSELLGSEVRDGSGAVVGRVVDLTVALGDAHPPVARLGVGRRRIEGWIPWSAVTALEVGAVSTRERPGAAGDEPGRDLHDDELLVRRDVLDTQVVDIAGKRVARVADVLLEHDGDRLRVEAVDVGSAAVWRRIGARWAAAHSPDQIVDWADLHLTSGRGHALHLVTPVTGIERLTPEQVATVVAHLPPHRAASLLGALKAETVTRVRAHLADRKPRAHRFAGVRRHLRPRRRDR